MVSDSVTMCVPLQLVAATLKCTASLDVGVPDSLMMLFEVVASNGLVAPQDFPSALRALA